ncbi:MAG: hypothetical protein IT269_10245 [Saprospiraceae bacterium]|nr:hypothetical protein [Saprospiraceae bacterium]
MTRSLVYAAFLGLFLLGMNACKKETVTETLANDDIKVISSDRANGRLYGVTVYSPGKPSRLIEMDQINNVVTNVYALTHNGLPIDDLKGVCCVGTALMVTTGVNNNPDLLDNGLFRVDLATSSTTYLSTSTVGTVSDIDYNPLTDEIKGLLNNSNNLVTITGASGFSAYSSTPITGVGAQTARGLTFVRGQSNAINLNIACNGNNTTTTTRYYDVDPVTGAAALLTNVLPANLIAGGNCGLGYDVFIGNLGRVFINRNTSTTTLGLRSFDNANPFGANTNTNASVPGFNLDDISTNIQ